VALLFIGRVITGVACGLGSAPATVYVGEMATNKYRGMLVTWPSVGVSGGILLVYLLGWGIQDDWRLVSGITIALPVLASLLAFFCLKETPSWLLSQGREQEAEVSFRWIRGVSENEAMPDEVRQEFEELVYNSKRRKSAQAERAHISTISNILDGKPTLSTVKQQSRFQKVWRRIASLANPEAWKPLVIHNFYFFCMQFGGIQVVAAYAVDIMESAGVPMDFYGATVLLGGVQFLAGIGATFAFSRLAYLVLFSYFSLLLLFSFSRFFVIAPIYVFFFCRFHLDHFIFTVLLIKYLLILSLYYFLSYLPLLSISYPLIILFAPQVVSFISSSVLQMLLK
jgi:SP family facilitated glucose transporter-like MFS transporter 8